jgi:hypothetical protein
MIAFVSSGVLDIPTSQPLLHTSLRPARLVVPSLCTLLIIKGVSVLVFPLAMSLYLAMPFSTSHASLSLPLFPPRAST